MWATFRKVQTLGSLHLRATVWQGRDQQSMPPSFKPREGSVHHRINPYTQAQELSWHMLETGRQKTHRSAEGGSSVSGLSNRLIDLHTRRRHLIFPWTFPTPKQHQNATSSPTGICWLPTIKPLTPGEHIFTLRNTLSLGLWSLHKVRFNCRHGTELQSLMVFSWAVPSNPNNLNCTFCSVHDYLASTT